MKDAQAKGLATVIVYLAATAWTIGYVCHPDSNMLLTIAIIHWLVMVLA